MMNQGTARTIKTIEKWLADNLTIFGAAHLERFLCANGCIKESEHLIDGLDFVVYRAESSYCADQIRRITAFDKVENANHIYFPKSLVDKICNGKARIGL